MEERFQIGEIAELLQINRSKLRFWEQQGLLQLERAAENHYRQYSFSDLLHITDIIFYRNLHFSTAELQQLFQQPAATLEQELAKKQQEIEAELMRLQQTHQEIIDRRGHLREAMRLRQIPDQFGKPDFQRMRQFRREESVDWQRSMQDQSAILGLQEDASAEVRYGLEADDGQAICIWQQQPGKQYVEVLLQYAMQDSNRNNAAQHCARLRQKGWQTGAILSRFLFSARGEDGVDYDYHKGWIEVSR